MQPELSPHFAARQPSAIRRAQILFAERADRASVRVVNLAIGNVTLPTHPAMLARLRSLGAPGSPFANGVISYGATVGTEEAQAAFRRVIASAGCKTDGLSCVVTDGGSPAMELALLGVCGPKATRPVLLLDPVYTNYMDMARRIAAPTVAVRRELGADGRYAAPDLAALERVIETHRPTALLVIPADNPTGSYLDQATLADLARLCVRHGLWLVSDEAYRQLHYTGAPVSSVWALTEATVPGITGRRIGIESASKVWNACGLRIGALVTDNPEFHRRAVAEMTANLCANVIGQHIFGALAHESDASLTAWYAQQRGYYAPLLRGVAEGLRRELPGVLVSSPDAALYSVVDVKALVPASFDAAEFVGWCAQHGRVRDPDGSDYTLLVAPLAGFYGERRPGDGTATRMRLAFVEPPDLIARVPRLFAALLRGYLATTP